MPTQDTSARGPRVLVLDRTGEFAGGLARAASGLRPTPEILRLRRPTRVGEVVASTPVDVIVASPEESTRTGLRRLAALREEHPGIKVVLSQNGKPVPADAAIACGATDVVPYPGHTARMRRALELALHGVAPLHVEAAVAAAPVAGGEVFTVTSATGGCGKTFYATNFAGYLARATGKRVVLVDLDLQFGEVSIALRLRPSRTIAELAEDGELHAIAGAVERHDAGYDVLCAPKDPLSAERVGPRETAEILEAARRAYDYVVVDTPPALNEVVLAAFDVSKRLVVMASMDIPSLRNLGVFLKTLDRLKVPADGVTLVLNKAEDGTGIEIDQVRKLHDFSAVIPYDREVSRSINVGMPVVFSAPSAEVSRRIVEAARHIVAPEPGADMPWSSAPQHRTPWLFRLFTTTAKRAARSKRNQTTSAKRAARSKRNQKGAKR